MRITKGKRVTTILCAVLILALCVPAFAHPGRTDANGGHWNHSTGEYHYHTGEYAGRNQSVSKSSTHSKTTPKSLEKSEQEYNANTNSKPTSQTEETKGKNVKVAAFLSIIFLGVPTIYSIFMFAGFWAVEFIEFIKKLFNRK